MSKISLILFNFDENDKITKEITEKYKNSEKFVVNTLVDADEVFGMVGEYGNAIFIFKVTTKKHLQDAVFLIKSNKNLVKKSLFKPACVLGIKNKKVEQVLARNGCKDLLDENIHIRTLGFKLDFWSKAIEKESKQKEKANEIKRLGSNKQNAAEDGAKKADFKFEKALEFESHFWIIKSKTDYKRVLRSYLIKILGPSPYIGKWYEDGTDSDSRQSVWKYKLVDPESDTIYMKNEGTWYFHGSKPGFDWKVKRWNFSSEKPHLFFKADNGEIISRISFNEGQVTLTENSDFALLRESHILKSCDTEFNIASDGVEKEESENLEGDEEKSAGNLKGKNSKDKEEGGHLHGKNSKEEASGGALSGKTKGETDKKGPMGGKSSTDNLGGGHYSNKEKAKSEDEIDDPFDQPASDIELDPFSGKQKGADELENDPFAGQGETDYLKPKLGVDHKNLANPDEFEKKEKEKKGFKEKDSGPLDGKTSTDEYGKDPLAGKTSTDEYGKDPLAGKGSTDELESHYDNESKFQEKKKGGPLDGKTSTDEYGKDPLAGKSSTDEYGKDPLAGKGSTDELESHYDNESKFQEKKQGGPLDGKTSTDEYGKDPLAGKSSTDQYGKDPLAGKTSTDQLESHMSNKEDPFQESAQKKETPNGFDDLADSNPNGDPLAGKKEEVKASGLALDSFDDLADSNPNGDPLAGKKEEAKASGLELDSFDDLADSNPNGDPLAGKKEEAKASGLALDNFDELADSNPNGDPLASKNKENPEASSQSKLDDSFELADSNSKSDPIASKKEEVEASGLALDSFDELADSNPAVDPFAKKLKVQLVRRKQN